MTSSGGSLRRSRGPLDEADEVFLEDRLVLGELRGPEHRRGRPGEVLEGHLAHPGPAVAALLDVLDLEADDHPAEDDLGLLGRPWRGRRPGGSPGPGAARRGGSGGGWSCRSRGPSSPRPAAGRRAARGCRAGRSSPSPARRRRSRPRCRTVEDVPLASPWRTFWMPGLPWPTRGRIGQELAPPGPEAVEGPGLDQGLDVPLGDDGLRRSARRCRARLRNGPPSSRALTIASTAL